MAITTPSNGQGQATDPTQIRPSLPPSPPPPSGPQPPTGRPPWYRRGWVIGVIALLVGIGLGAAAGGSNKTTTTTIASPAQTVTLPAQTTTVGADNSPSAGSPTFKNGVLTTPDVKIQITRFKVIKPGQKGNEDGTKPVIAFWYKTTNLSGAKVNAATAFIFHFNAYQDNNPNAYNELNLGSTPDERFRNSQGSETIKKGGTVEDAVSYELDDLVTPVDLVATESLAGEVIGKATYKLR